MGSHQIKGVGRGADDDRLEVGAKSSSIWDISSKDAKKNISARAIEVMFEDGSKWSLRKE
jgi:hypothetical protein